MTSENGGFGMDKARPIAASERAWRAFRERVEDLGGTVLDPIWLGSKRPHRIRCAVGHENAPRPTDVQKGHGICRTCAGKDPAAAEQEFRARVAELGGTVLDPTWLGVNRPHRVRCAVGHESTPHPNNVRQGQGICRTCAGRDSAAAEQAFHAAVAAVGGVVLEPSWLGTRRPHRVRCAVGHENAPQPGHVQQGDGICRTCAGQDPVASWQAFHARVSELGGTVLEPAWLGKDRPHRTRCAAGHESMPRPTNVQQGRGICRTCAGKDSVASERAFRAAVEALGGVVLEPTWLGKDRPHRVRCAVGHESTPHPGNVQQGRGICRTCAGKAWDVFYVVADDEDGHVKFGITSGDPRPRLRTHAAAGYGSVVRLLVGLPGDTAPELERSVKACLRLAREKPVRGREYFDASVLPLILDVVDNYPTHCIRGTAIRAQPLPLFIT